MVDKRRDHFRTWKILMHLCAPWGMNGPGTFLEGVGESAITGTAVHPFQEGSARTRKLLSGQAINTGEM